MGHGVVDGRDYHSLNFDAGFHLWPSIDVVIAIGTRFQVQAMQWRTNRCKAIILIEIDPNEMNCFGKPTVGLCGDAGRVGLVARAPAALQ